MSEKKSFHNIIDIIGGEVQASADGIRSQYISEKLPETPTVVPIGYVK